MLNRCCLVAAALICAYVALQVNSASLASGSTELWVGQCDYRFANRTNLLYSKNVHNASIPFKRVNNTVRYFGNRPIICVKALLMKWGATGSKAQIKSGGYGSQSVTIFMESAVGQGLDYNVTIYEDKRRR